MPLYCDDFIASTADMSCDELGAYTRLLCHIWSRGPVPLDETVICRVAGCTKRTWSRIRGRFSPCQRDDGTPGLSQTRLEAERLKRVLYAEERAEAGRRGAARRWHGTANGTANGSSMASHNHNHIDTSSVVITTRASEAAPAPQAAGLPRLRSVDADETVQRNRAAIAQFKRRTK